MKNIYYFKSIAHIGGIETFFRELSKKYKDWDITFFYEYADHDQLREIKKYCRCKRFEPSKQEIIKCDKAFFNFNLDMLPFVDAKEKILVVHGNYKMLDGPPPRDDRITKAVAVSKDSADAYKELTGIDCEVCYNPLTFEDYKKEIRIICPCRLEDKVKGIWRLEKFVNAMDSYCAMHNRNYTLEIFTNGGSIDSPNVVIRRGRIDIRPYMKNADYLIQLSDNVEGFNYSVNEMLKLFKKPVIITPCNVFKELGINDSMAVIIDFDMKNLDEAIKKIFNSKWNINYDLPEDRWNELLAKGKSTYEEEKNMMIKVRVLDDFANVRDNTINGFRKVGDVFEVTPERFDVLDNFYMNGVKLNLVEKIEEVKVKPEIKEAPVEETILHDTVAELKPIKKKKTSK